MLDEIPWESLINNSGGVHGYDLRLKRITLATLLRGGGGRKERIRKRRKLGGEKTKGRRGRRRPKCCYLVSRMTKLI